MTKNADKKGDLMVCSKCGSDEIHAKGLCHGCYSKEWYKNNLDKVKKTRNEYRKRNPDVIKNINNRWRKNNPEKLKESQRKYHERLYRENPGLKEEALKKMEKSHTCKIIKKHHDDMKDDPESLTTEFMQKMIGVDCDK